MPLNTLHFWLIDFDEEKKFKVLNLDRGQDFIITTPHGSKGSWFLERTNKLPQSSPISFGRYVQIKNLTLKDGGFYYCYWVLEKDSYYGGLFKAEVRVFG